MLRFVMFDHSWPNICSHDAPPCICTDQNVIGLKFNEHNVLIIRCVNIDYKPIMSTY